MKKNFLAIALLTIAGGWWMAARPGDIVTDLGLTTEQVREAAFANITSDHLSLPYTSKVRQLAKKIPDGSRAAAVNALGGVIRSYASSSDFRTRYLNWLKDKYRISDEQTREATQAQSTSLNDAQAAYNQQVAMIQSTYSQMPPATLSMMIQSQIEMTQQDAADAEGAEKTARTKELAELKRLQALSKTNPTEFKKQYVAHFSKMLNQQAAADQGKMEEDLARSKQQAADYQKRLADYKAASNLNAVLKQHLTEFIALTGSVDFNAQLTRNGSKMEFVNPEYRNKSANWKLLYRMGKEPVLAARLFAQTWAKELETKK
ncbi:hypothetical protein ACFQ4C_02360 [Larkinella insperata]|uniref:DUF3826 domain-containing protein n=1 Tax=Larkinella insperata TaxID=332158 RepID=A0ABW3QJE5_9BACT|nr:hypothetical protein [Larkinella insperata]